MAARASATGISERRCLGAGVAEESEKLITLGRCLLMRARLGAQLRAEARVLLGEL